MHLSVSKAYDQEIVLFSLVYAELLFTRQILRNIILNYKMRKTKMVNLLTDKSEESKLCFDKTAFLYSNLNIISKVLPQCL
jgi:hypothetical protein